MSYIGIGTNKPNHSLEIEGNMLVSNIELGTANQGVPFEIYSNYSNKSFLTNSRQLRLRTTPRFTPDDTSHIDMGMNNVTGNTFIISEPVFNTVISGNRTFELDNQGSTTLQVNNVNAINTTADMLKLTNGLVIPSVGSYIQVLDKNNAKKSIKVEKISSLHYSTLILSNEGAVYGAGDNFAGQLGLGYESSVEPTFKACVGKASSNVTHISCGFFHSMIIRDDSSLWATGKNASYQFGNGSTVSTSSFTSITDNVAKVEASDAYTVILKNDGSVWGAGENGRRQLGLGATGQYVTTFTKALGAGSSGVVDISPTWLQFGYDTRHVMIVKEDGSVWGSGDNVYGQLGTGDTSIKTTFTQALETGSIPVSNATSVSAGISHSIILKDDSIFLGTGVGANGSYGQGLTGYTVFTSVTNDVKQIFAGNQYSLILKNNGSVWGSGVNYRGQIGLGSITSTDSFTQATSNVTEIVGTYAPDDLDAYTIVLKDDDKIYGSGSNFQGQFGIGISQLTQTTTTITELKYAQNINIETSNIISSKFTKDFNLHYEYQNQNPVYTRFKALATSGSSFFLIDENDNLYARGPNFRGKLGLGGILTATDWVYVTDNVRQVSAGEDHSMIIKNDGSVWGTGINNFGELANVYIPAGGGSYTSSVTRFTPCTGAGTSGVVQVSAGNAHTTIIKDDGSVWGSGYNRYGQIGIGITSVSVLTFTSAIGAGTSDVSNVSSGYYHTLMLKNDGSVWGTGYNNNGELGIGTTDNKNTYTAAVGVGTSGVSQISTSRGWETFSIILKSDGSVWGTGNNDYGQLGNGTFDSALTFTSVEPARNDIVKISASGEEPHTVIQKNDGTLLGAGKNFDPNATVNIFTSLVDTSVTNFAEDRFLIYGDTDYNIFATIPGIGINLNYNFTPYQYKNILPIPDGLVSIKKDTSKEALIGQDQGIMKLGVAVATQSSNTFVTINGTGTVSATSYIPFTGKHKGYISEIPEKGMIVSVIHSNYQNINSVDTWLKESSIHKDPNVFGVSDGEKLFNAVGEGAIWVCNANGPLTSGDYIVSSTLTGYGIRQEGTRKANYTVAKILQDCNFEDDKTRYLSMSEDNSLSTISKEQYLEDNGNVYKASFVGCTYHCG
jgi:alpha-tubulin suppressor-like RCC1 family protein